MAISKERLEKLIKEGATIYNIDYNSNTVEPINLLFTTIDGNTRHIKGEAEGTIFETQKQAEWALRYHATRTEELDLPMWEELPLVFEKSFVTRNSAYYLSSSKPQDNISLLKYKNIMLFPCLDMGLEQIYVGRLTEENYIKACDLCLKLFMGEEDE